ncbi:MAG: hypothetical protein A2V64_09480 [Bacteroidetes bacterium RBG_13_43_22]|nr:MAG: hypothetical protein A2V64_09480 [Bacteroidetes bacterium RBG_13_43_22]
MSKKQIISGQWVSGKNRIKCSLPLIIFEEDNNVITYCPALDLSGYGSNEEEAKKSFEVTLSEYFKYTVNKKTLAEDLKKHGWIIRKDLKKEPIPPTLENLLQSNDEFSRIFNTYDIQTRHTTINIPALV